jgi:hypothetical protein
MEQQKNKENTLTIYHIANEYVMDQKRLSSIIKNEVVRLLTNEEETQDNTMKSVEMVNDVLESNDITSYYIPLDNVEVFNLNNDDIQPTFQKVGVKLSISIL